MTNPKSDSSVTISKQEYEDLLEDAEFLARLRAAGVDNWEGYHEGCGGPEKGDDESYEDIYG